MPRLILVPLTVKAAIPYVARWHRTHRPPRGGLFAIGAQRDGELDLCGVAIVGRPKSRILAARGFVEVTRMATPTPEPIPRSPDDHAASVCSFLYRRAGRAAQALGWIGCKTYTLASESGASLRAAGAVLEHETDGESWDRPSRSRTDKHPTEPKLRWAI